VFVKEFDVLLVDDEPDVLEVSRLAMRSFRVYGLPLRLHTAKSKAEAIALYDKTFPMQVRGMSTLMVAFIDVVMETDHAGLELCEYIREKKGDKNAQLYVRTGQPGVAPQRMVIERYDISGYIAKAEVTEDKLYTLVKSGIRQAYCYGTAVVLGQILQGLVVASDSREKLEAALARLAKQPRTTAEGRAVEVIDFWSAYVFDGKVVSGAIDADAKRAGELRDRLKDKPGAAPGPEGDKVVVDGRDFLFKIAKTPTTAEMYYVGTGTAPLPEVLVGLYQGFLRSVAAMWQKAH
jgi:CheY-like chemotaxis protein